MSSLDLERLEDKRTEIIKAEIGALLFNLGKTHAGFEYWRYKLSFDEKAFEKTYGYPKFDDYRKYYKEIEGESGKFVRFKEDLKRINKDFPDFFYKTEVGLMEGLLLSNIVYCDAINKKDVSRDDIEKFIKNTQFHGCENINSGIDKGAPPKNQSLNNLWISNAFGSFKEKFTKDMCDSRRLRFLEKLWEKISSMGKKPGDFEHDDWLELRGYIFDEVRNWYSHVLSDSRFPINDVTLWDQAYMTASLFKAAIAAIQLDNTKLDDYWDENKCRRIKWCILGVQYDKLGLAEKALKAHYISSYRDASVMVDNRVKEIIEEKYALGNEIYRDETGIYFVVPENVGDSESSDAYSVPLNKSLKVIENDILRVFSKHFDGEIYPSILVTKPSRGTMNIAYLLENSRENFLKAIYPRCFKTMFESTEHRSDDEKNNENKQYNGLCQVCRFRLAERTNNDLMTCAKCNERKIDRISNWEGEINGETIWTGDLQDDNGRVALVTLKFELLRWINGDLINTTLNNNAANIRDNHEKIKNTLLAIKEIKAVDGSNIEKYKQKKKDNQLKEFIMLVDGILSENNVSTTLQKKFSIDYSNDEYKPKKNSQPQDLDNIVKNNKKFETFIKKFEFHVFRDLVSDAYGPYTSLDGYRELTYEDFLVEVFLEHIIGDRWEGFIKDKLEEKIDFQSRSIIWDKLEDDDIDFLAGILLQFLLRKNPSPARLKRIWETTQGFYIEQEKKLINLIGIEEWRSKRLVWYGAIKERQFMNKEYAYKGLDFWANGKGDVHLISSIEQAIPIITKDELKKDIKKSKKHIEGEICRGNTGWIDVIRLKDYHTGKDTEIVLNESDAKYEPYKPFITIMEPTPVSWQFIIPAKYITKLIGNIQKEYKREFKYVAGKLPLHIGIVVQDYKKPLYMGIKALRKIRRDIDDWDCIAAKEKVAKIKEIQNEGLSYHVGTLEERTPDNYENEEKPTRFYSLYPAISKEEGEYQFNIGPKGNKSNLRIVDSQHSDPDTKDDDIELIVYPNTIDFEYMDVNIRRNDIYYSKEDGEYSYCPKGKRRIADKINRPYTWEDWKLFLNFYYYFRGKDKTNKFHQTLDMYENDKVPEGDNEKTIKLHRIINQIYSKLHDWKDNEDSIKSFMLSAFINILGLKDDNEGIRERDRFVREIFALRQIDGKTISKWSDVESMPPDEFKRCLLRFVDMYEFWHKALKRL